jgi:hypothetical protein
MEALVKTKAVTSNCTIILRPLLALRCVGGIELDGIDYLH